MQPLKIKVEISNEPHIAMPEILLNLLNLKSGDYVYIPLDSINAESGTEPEDISTPVTKPSIRPTIEQKPMIEQEVIFQKIFEETMRTNPLFKKSYDKLTEFTKDNRVYIKNPQKTMIAFYTPKCGLCWLEYKRPGARPFPVHLAKENYAPVDPQKRVIYSSETRKTFGDFPVFSVEKESDIEYLFNLVKYAIEKLVG